MNGCLKYSGDFRYDTKMKYYPPLRDISVEAVYLDNTFCDPNYTFPKQSVTVKSIVDIVRKEVRCNVFSLFICSID